MGCLPLSALLQSFTLTLEVIWLVMWKTETCWKASFHLFYALVEPSTSEVSIFFISSAPFVLHCWSCILQSVSKTLKFELMSHKCGVC